MWSSISQFIVLFDFIVIFHKNDRTNVMVSSGEMTVDSVQALKSPIGMQNYLTPSALFTVTATEKQLCN